MGRTFLIVMVIGGAGSLWGPIIGAVLYVFVTEKTGEWANDEAIPAIIRPLFAWANWGIANLEMLHRANSEDRIRTAGFMEPAVRRCDPYANIATCILTEPYQYIS